MSTYKIAINNRKRGEISSAKAVTLDETGKQVLLILTSLILTLNFELA
jgi:hypothetical protein